MWEGNAGPPSHSVPPQLAAKAAAELGEDAFDAVHDRLLHAYFAESRDITEPETLRALWCEAGLPAAEFGRMQNPQLLRETLQQHQAALEAGVTGAPAVQLAGEDVAIVGAHPLTLYRRWVERTARARTQSAGDA